MKDVITDPIYAEKELRQIRRYLKLLVTLHIQVAETDKSTPADTTDVARRLYSAIAKDDPS